MEDHEWPKTNASQPQAETAAMEALALQPDVMPRQVNEQTILPTVSRSATIADVSVPGSQLPPQIYVPVPVAVAEPTLVNAQIEFYTRDDNKNTDTLLTVTVEDFRRVVAARISGFFAEFRDQSTAGPFALRILNASTKSAMQRGAVTVRIDPKDEDTWKFNFFLSLVFSDSSSLQASANGVEVSDQVKELTVGVGGMA